MDKSGAGERDTRANDPRSPAGGVPAGSGADAFPPGPSVPDPSTQVAELEDRLRRALADLDNLRKRYDKAVERERAAERARVAAAWLPMLDNLELALSHAQADPSSIIAGVRTVRDQAIQTLAQLGYRRQDEQDEEGVPFDPNRHEVVHVVDEPELEPGIVTEVLRPGYGDAERQLRPVAVAVNRPRE